MSCGGSHGSNANSAVISGTVKEVNSTFDREAAMKQLQEARKEREAKRAAAFAARHGEESAWATPLLIDTDRNTEQFLSKSKDKLVTVSLDTVEVFAGGWDEPRYRDANGYEAVVEMQLKPSDEFPNVYLFPGSPDEPIGVRMNEAGEAEKVTVKTTYDDDDLDEERPIHYVEQGWSEWDEEIMHNIGHEELAEHISIADSEIGRLSPYVENGVPYLRYEEDGVIEDPEPDYPDPRDDY